MGADLNLCFGGLDYTIPYEYDKDLKWYHYILENIYQTENMDQLCTIYKERLKKDETPMVFLFNSWDTSHTYACTVDYPDWQEEFCVIFCDTDMHDNYLTHEIMHLYGAIDLYDYDNEGVQSVAEKYFPNSDMLTVSHEIDDLTAYLVGWTDTLSYDARIFIDETRGLR